VVPPNRVVELNCGGRILKSHTDRGNAKISPGGTLKLVNCNWDSFQSDVAGQTVAEGTGSLLPGMKLFAGVGVSIIDSLIRKPCSVRSSAALRVRVRSRLVL
jgi:hypothetical protein